jgi:hypothetical protein
VIATRVVVVVLALVFARYAYLDTIYHLRVRKPSTAENLLHLLLGLCELVLIGAALAPHKPLFFGGAAGTAALGAIDEFGFHRGLPADENDYHAKGHLALFALFAAASVLPEVLHGH